MRKENILKFLILRTFKFKFLYYKYVSVFIVFWKFQTLVLTSYTEVLRTLLCLAIFWRGRKRMIILSSTLSWTFYQNYFYIVNKSSHSVLEYRHRNPAHTRCLLFMDTVYHYHVSYLFLLGIHAIPLESISGRWRTVSSYE